jgi:antitoxin VapB
MSLNIKNPEAHRAAKEVAEITGESLTQAVTVALEERLQRLRAGQDEARLQRMMALAKDIASRLKEPYKSIDHADLLYDERGLPK